MMEKRELINQMEARMNNKNSAKTIAGYAVKWGKLSHPMGSGKKFQETFIKGAFEETIKRDDQRALFNHDTSCVLGRTKNNTLRLIEDDIGLRFEIDLASTSLGNDIYESVSRGDIDGVSFGFLKQKDIWNENNKGVIRTITKAKLLEISPVTFPAYPDSEVSKRNNNPYEEFKNKNLLKRKLILKTYL